MNFKSMTKVTEELMLGVPLQSLLIQMNSLYSNITTKNLLHSLQIQRTYLYFKIITKKIIAESETHLSHNLHHNKVNQSNSCLSFNLLLNKT